MIPYSILLRIAPYLVVVLILFGGGFYIHHKGFVLGEAVVQEKFDKFVSDSDAAVKAHLAQDAIDRDNAEKTNAQVLIDLAKQRDDAVAAGNATASKLRDYIAKASGGSVPKTDNQSAADAAAFDESIARLGRAVGDLREECAKNNSQLIGLQDELRPQL